MRKTLHSHVDAVMGTYCSVLCGFTFSQNHAFSYGGDSFRVILVDQAEQYVQPACLPSSCQAKSQQYCEPKGSTTNTFYGILITQSVVMVFILNLDNVLLKKLFPTMNI